MGTPRWEMRKLTLSVVWAPAAVATIPDRQRDRHGHTRPGTNHAAIVSLAWSLEPEMTPVTPVTIFVAALILASPTWPRPSSPTGCGTCR